MEEFLLEDYITGKGDKRSKIDRARARRAIALFNEGLRDLGVFAEALEVSVAEVKRLLGEDRTQMCLENVAKEPKEQKSTKPAKEKAGKPKRFTERDAERYAKERDVQIRDYFLEGLDSDEIASRCHMTKGQVEERLLAMGLPIYSKEEFEEMQRKRDEEERIRLEKSKEKEEAEQSVSPESGVDDKAEAEVEEEQREEEQEENEGYKSYEEIIKAIKGFIKNRNSIKAADIARIYANEKHGSFLTEKQRAKLADMADVIKMIKERYRKINKREKEEKEK